MSLTMLQKRRKENEKSKRKEKSEGKREREKRRKKERAKERKNKKHKTKGADYCCKDGKKRLLVICWGGICASV